MIKIEETYVTGFEQAIRGMRNPKNSWHLSDSTTCNIEGYIYEDCVDCILKDYDGPCNEDHNDFVVGPKDLDLMRRLAKGGPVHAKYRRMIAVYADITAPLYWWKEFDTYKVGTVANSCSTMHKITDKEFELDDFSHEHLSKISIERYLHPLISHLNFMRGVYNHNPENKGAWWQLIQLLPSSYNQKRTVMLNYEVLHNIYFSRRNHKLDEWHEFCAWIASLPHSELITMEEVSNE